MSDMAHQTHTESARLIFTENANLIVKKVFHACSTVMKMVTCIIVHYQYITSM